MSSATPGVCERCLRCPQADERDHRLGTQDHVSKWQLADVQSLAGHTSLADTQRYVDQSPETKRRVVAM